MSLFPQSTRVDWLAAEISRKQMDFAQILQLVMWIRTIPSAQKKLTNKCFLSAAITNQITVTIPRSYFSDMTINNYNDDYNFYSPGITIESIFTRMVSFAIGAHRPTSPFNFTNGYFDRILLYRIPAESIPEEGIAGGDAGRGLWLRLKNTCKQFKFSLNQILPTLFTLRGNESRIIAVMSSNADDLLHGYLPEEAEAMNSVLQQFLVGKEEHGNFMFCRERIPTRRRLWHSRHSQGKHRTSTTNHL